jgi:hypothetical protein
LAYPFDIKRFYFISKNGIVVAGISWSPKEWALSSATGKGPHWVNK